eukprot:comp23539_c0_seq1/m.58917 comp23539_c0_seq1/g.58917  ORF comp23539_c0_seq1/g.58917 comp23539_c0_seq1/m.58917 type:complete len:330 (+) comp23539_c0_seq1:2565-3554(+)
MQRHVPRCVADIRVRRRLDQQLGHLEIVVGACCKERRLARARINRIWIRTRIEQRNHHRMMPGPARFHKHGRAMGAVHIGESARIHPGLLQNLAHCRRVAGLQGLCEIAARIRLLRCCKPPRVLEQLGHGIVALVLGNLARREPGAVAHPHQLLALALDQRLDGLEMAGFAGNVQRSHSLVVLCVERTPGARSEQQLETFEPFGANAHGSMQCGAAGVVGGHQVCIGIDEDFQHMRTTHRCRENRRCLARAVACINVGAVLEQELHHIDIVCCDSNVQRCLIALVLGPRKLRILRNHLARRGQLALLHHREILLNKLRRQSGCVLLFAA